MKPADGTGHCILALDLGTSAFKAAPVGPSGLLADPVAMHYELDYTDGRITCPAERYFATAMAALRQAADAAQTAGCPVEAIGISSQAQTYLALDRNGAPLGDAVVWLDDRAFNEATRLSEANPDTAALCGFGKFTGQQFLPKVLHLLGTGDAKRERVGRFLLLNEYLAHRLTGRAYGDETSQGMGGFYDISKRGWSADALSIAGIATKQLAPVYPAAAYGSPIIRKIRRELGLDAIPVYLCGNDQCCAAAGADLQGPGDVLCNFGTAMVVYSRKDDRPTVVTDSQIAGIDPLTSRYFLLGLEGNCGNVVSRGANLLFRSGDLAEMLAAAAGKPPLAPEIREQIDFGAGAMEVDFARISSRWRPEVIAQALLEQLAARFMALLREVRGVEVGGGQVFVSGGLSRSSEWLDLLARTAGVTFVRAENEHAGLLGIARIVSRNRGSRPEPLGAV